MQVYELKANSFPVAVAAFQVLHKYTWLVAAVSESTDVDCFHDHRKFNWTTLVWEIVPFWTLPYTFQRVKGNHSLIGFHSFIH